MIYFECLNQSCIFSEKKKSHRSRWLHQILIGEIVISYFYKLFNRFGFSLLPPMQILRGNRDGCPILYFRCLLPIHLYYFRQNLHFKRVYLNICFPKSVKIAVRIYCYRFFFGKCKCNYRRFSNLKAFSLNSFVCL